MNKENLIQLTNELYRITLLFPRKEPLRYKMRELADEILANSLRNTNQYEYTNTKNKNYRGLTSIISQLEILDSFFEIAKSQNWVSPVELLRIQEEYNRIKAEIKKNTKQPVETERGQTSAKLTEVRPRQTAGGRPRQIANSRQEKILEFLKENGRAQVGQLKQIFPEVTKRTLRRDFEFLLKQGKIERIGERNDTFYQIKELSEVPAEGRRAVGGSESLKVGHNNG